MKLEVYFEASYKQINIRKKRSYRYNYTQNAESTMVKVSSYEGHITLFPVWYRASFLKNLERSG